MVCILPSQTAKTDVAVMPENIVLPKTFHPTDELAAQWKTIGPERHLSQPRISSAQDIIKVKQGLLARCISGLSLYQGFLNCPRTSVQIRQSGLDVSRGMVTPLVGQDAAGVLGDAVLGHPPQPWSDPSKAPTSSKPYGCICGCEGWAKGIRKLEDEVNSRAQKKTGRLMAGTQPKTKVKMEMLII